MQVQLLVFKLLLPTDAKKSYLYISIIIYKYRKTQNKKGTYDYKNLREFYIYKCIQGLFTDIKKLHFCIG